MSPLRRVSALFGATVLLATVFNAPEANAFLFLRDPGPRPSKWCGWQMRKEVWSDPGPAFNRAIEWRRFGTAASGPAVGVIVVWPHHVGKIVGRDETGQWIVRSGNDGGILRERARSLHGAVAYRWP